jgi:hypothetical protein
MRPRSQQNDRQIRFALADCPKQRNAHFARGRVDLEIHILQHEIDTLASEHRKPFIRTRSAQRANVAQAE